ncbi:MAG: DUF1851 domain-containing protein [Hymenobacter sp.]|nr:MAG: DUF1851 domain-containing protein [Hymenobacter sp.]
MKEFLSAYHPEPAAAIEPAQLAQYQPTLPADILALWQEYGFCQFNGGLLRLVDPALYRPALTQWLGGERPHYVPLALSAFGDLFYYRQLTETGADVCLLDPHYRRIATCAWSLADFFGEYLLDEEVREDVLRESLAQEAHVALGPLAPNEIYCFTPALALGGAEELPYLTKGDAPTHLHLLFGLTQ